MLQIINKRKYFYFISATLVISGLGAIFIWGMNFGIDFTGGTEMKIEFSQNIPKKNVIEEKLKELNLVGFSLKKGEKNLIILQYEKSDDDINRKVLEKIKEIDSNAKQLSVNFIGASVSSRLKTNAVEAIMLSILGIAIYISVAFRKVSRPVSSWKYGLGAIIALAHDVIITTGIFSFLGRFYGVKTDVAFVAALLTILGYSVNDTIVVYDRIRENILRSGKKDEFEAVINRSLNETLARSINTSFTVIMVLIFLIIFGSEAIRYFSLALLIGVSFGTYSSIFVASALIATIYKFQINRK